MEKARRARHWFRRWKIISAARAVSTDDVAIRAGTSSMLPCLWVNRLEQVGQLLFHRHNSVHILLTSRPTLTQTLAQNHCRIIIVWNSTFCSEKNNSVYFYYNSGRSSRETATSFRYIENVWSRYETKSEWRGFVKNINIDFFFWTLQYRHYLTFSFRSLYTFALA